VGTPSRLARTVPEDIQEMGLSALVPSVQSGDDSAMDALVPLGLFSLPSGAEWEMPLATAAPGRPSLAGLD
jgi:hypothetical protein